MKGFHFAKYIPEQDKRSPFERLLEIFLELVTYTSGDVDEALDWLRELDKEHSLTDENYTIEDFIEDLFEKGYLREPGDGNDGGGSLSYKSEQAIRKRSLDQIFGKMKKGTQGAHRTNTSGKGDELTGDKRPYRFGDNSTEIDFTNSIRNAQVRGGLGEFSLHESDLEVNETTYKSSASTVLMIDISHSMILYGEDRITPAKKVAMALSEFITTRYPKDTLDIVVFGNDAWQISIKDLPYLKVGPYHTNTVAGLRLAMDLLRRRKNPNKQIFMITDGKPSCLKVDGGYYKNSFGLDPTIVNKCLNLATECRKIEIPITTFMIAEDPYLQRFVEDFTEANQGRAIYTGLSGLGEWIFSDYERNRKRRV
jgi:uncharacterized protein with von Willebrand factor type A (vWA) domain